MAKRWVMKDSSTHDSLQGWVFESMVEAIDRIPDGHYLTEVDMVTLCYVGNDVAYVATDLEDALKWKEEVLKRYPNLEDDIWFHEREVGG